MSRNTRDRLIEAGERLFAANGFERTTVGDIEAAAGLSPRAGGFYRHFKSKEALLVELADRRFERPEDLGVHDVFPLEDTRAELIYIARAYLRLQTRSTVLATVMRLEAPRIPELEARFKQANKELSDALTDWIAGKPAARKLDRAAAAELAIIVFGGWLFYLSRKDEFDPPKGFDDNRLLMTWADHWAEALDIAP